MKHILKVRTAKSTLRMCITPVLKSLDDEGPAPLLALDQTCIICEKYITDSTDRSHNAKWDDMHIQQNIL